MASPRRCLVVEVDELWEARLRRILAAHQFDVDSAHTYEEARDRIANSGPYDLVTLDLSLDRDRRFTWGLTLLGAMREMGARGSPPVVVVTGSTEYRDFIQLINAGIGSSLRFVAEKGRFEHAQFHAALGDVLGSSRGKHHLVQGQTYGAALLRVDAVEHTELAQRAPADVAETTFNALQSFVRRIVEEYGGQELNFTGDGGLYAFLGDYGKSTRAVLASIAILARLESFNAESNDLARPIRLREAAHVGVIVYREPTGLIQSNDINLVSKLEKAAPPDGLLVTGELRSALSNRLPTLFSEAEEIASLGIRAHRYVRQRESPSALR